MRRLIVGISSVVGVLAIFASGASAQCSGGSCSGGSCSSGSYPTSAFSAGAFSAGSCPGGSCPGGSCPGGSCQTGSYPQSPLSVGTSMFSAYSAASPSVVIPGFSYPAGIYDTGVIYSYPLHPRQRVSVVRPGHLGGYVLFP